jgi:hypothetical protein
VGATRPALRRLEASDMAGTLPAFARGSGQPRSRQERLWLTGGAFAAFIMLLVGYFFFVSPQRSDTSSLKSQVVDAQQRNTVLEARINSLRQQNKNVAKYQAQYAQARLALPSTAGVSDFVRSLQALGNATLTDVSSLTVGLPTNVSPATLQPANSTASPAAPSSTVAPAPGGATVPGGNTATASPQVYALTITADVSGSPAALGKFLDQLQRVQPRAVLITQLTQRAATSAQSGKAVGNSTSLTLSMQAFVAPANPTESAALAQASSR